MNSQMKYQSQVFKNPHINKLVRKVYSNMSNNQIREFILKHESIQALRKMNHKRQSPDILRNLYVKTFNLKPLLLRSGNGKTLIKYLE